MGSDSLIKLGKKYLKIIVILTCVFFTSLASVHFREGYLLLNEQLTQAILSFIGFCILLVCYKKWNTLKNYLNKNQKGAIPYALAGIIMILFWAMQFVYDNYIATTVLRYLFIVLGIQRSSF